MATTEEQLKQEGSEFEAAFNQPDPDVQGTSEDEAFGITPDVSADTGEGEGEPVTTTVEEPAGEGTELPAEEAAEPVAEELGETPVEEAAEVPAEPSQQERSWEGRLRKREEELAAREAALRDAESKSAAPAGDPAAEVDGGLEGEEPSGDITAEQAIAKLAEDFGDEFVGMIVAIATAKAKEAAAAVAGESVSGVSQNVEGIISHLRNRAAREHFKAIHAMHPDFQEMHAAPEFEAYLVSLPEAEQADARSVLESGEADDVNALLTAYKNSQTQTDNSENTDAAPEDDGWGDEAEGVRSSGIRLPSSPADSDDYAGAWDNA